MRYLASYNQSYLWSGYSWVVDGAGNPVQSFVALSYNYVDSLPEYYLGTSSSQNNPANVIPIDPSVTNSFDAAREMWSDVANISWTPSTSADVTFGFYTGVSGGLAYYPAPIYDPLQSMGDIWLDPASNSASALGAGGYGFSLLLHEIGHAVGLQHTIPSPTLPAGTPVPTSPVNEDSVLYSTMTSTQGGYSGRFNVTPMMHDIVTVQRLYGANTSHNSTDTIYSFSDNSHPFDGITPEQYDDPGSVLMTLWDGGGFDSINASAMTRPVFIDLEPGTYSAVGTLSSDPSQLSESQLRDALNVGIAYGAGIENATGGSGSDWINGNAQANVLDGGPGSGLDILVGGDGNDILAGGDGADTLYGGAGDDILFGDDDAQPGGAVDVLEGGAGYDTYYAGVGDEILDEDLSGEIEFLSYGPLTGGDDLDRAGLYANEDYSLFYLQDEADGSITVYGEQGELRIATPVGTELPDPDIITYPDGSRDVISGLPGMGIALVRHEELDEPADPDFDGSNFITGNASNNIITGTQLDDVIFGGGGNDTITDTFPSISNDLFSGGSGDDSLHGGWGHDVVIGGSGDDLLFGDYGDDVLIGGLGNDSMFGDSHISQIGDDLYVYAQGDGADRIDDIGGIDTVRLDNITPGDVQVTRNGDHLALHLLDQSGQRINGQYLQLERSVVNDAVSTGPYEKILFSDGTVWTTAILAAHHLIGGDYDDAIQGFATSDEIQAGAGNDSVSGGAGDDEIYAGDGDDTIHGGIGSDTVYAGDGNDIAFELDDDSDDVLYGEAGDDQMNGGAGDDYLDGGPGTNTLQGGADNDTLVAGNDGQWNYLHGDSGNDTLYGGTGLSILYGGQGSDTYHVDSTSTFIFEFFPGDHDVVIASVSYTAPSDVEELILTGSGDLSASGNNLDNPMLGTSGANTLYGLAGNDTINGGGGADTLFGGTGNDTMIVDNVGDVVVEYASEGNDTIESSVSYTLSSNVENLTLTGVQSINGTGNGVANVIIGNDGDNILDGRGGDDLLAGGQGNDTYVLDSPLDTIVELANEGADLVLIAFTYELLENVEALTLTGSLPADGTGNSLANTLVGNAAANILDGGGGADTMSGGLGNDGYIVDDAADTVQEFSNEGTDTVYASVTHVLAANIENLTLTGTATIDGAGNELNNQLLGNSASNVLLGGAGADVLDGGGGLDSMEGGSGDDTYFVDSIGDLIVEAAGNGIDTVISEVDYVLGDNVENLFLIGAADVNGTGNDAGNELTGNTGMNVLSGGLGNDVLDGNGGADILAGGSGDDLYLVSDSLVTVMEAAGEGLDSVHSSVSVALWDNVENLTLVGTGNIDGAGNALDNLLQGNSGSNELAGGAGNDTYILDSSGDLVVELAGEGSDTVISSASYALTANVENLTLTGAQSVNGTGNGGSNVILGNAGDNVLDGQSGDDLLVGGAGNDTYVLDTPLDAVVELAGEGVDLVTTAFSYELPENVESLTLTGSQPVDGTGNALANTLIGNTAANVLDGGGGADAMSGGLGDDEYIVDDTADAILEASDEGSDTVYSSVTYALAANIENLTLTGSANIDGFGNVSDNIITGNSGVNALAGGAGNDLYYVGAGDSVIEGLGEGLDWVYTSVTFTLGANVENVTLLGSTAVNATGNALNNTLVGNAGANTLTGGAGDDTYHVNAGDTVVEGSNQGTDTVVSEASWTLGANFENLTLTGTAALNATGNSLANVLTGNDGANVLTGGTGDDSYFVGAGDTVNEGSNAGNDTVYAPVSWTLGANLERLTLTGTDNVDAVGNTLANVLTGNSGNNRLDGGSGSDTMLGGAGDDVYVVGATGDVVIENTGEGTDTVESSVTYTLGVNLENLLLTGTANRNGTGNALDNLLIGNSGSNTLTGNDGNDYLDGGAGSDTMRGGAGDDTYVVERTTDSVTENASAGTDTVLSTIGYTLGANVENLTLLGSTAINATGNALNNVLTGNAGTNTISGAAGNDTLEGMAGADTLIGGTGNDTYRVGRGHGAETVQENDSTSGNVDVGQFLADIAPDQIWFLRSSNDLVASIIGTQDQMTVQNWYAGSQYHLEQFRTADGATLLDSQVQNLVDAMAAFAPPAPGQTTLPPEYALALAPVIAANWQ